MRLPTSVTVVQPHVRMGDPHVCSDDRHRLSLLHAMYDPLVRRGAGGKHVPALATSWELTDDAKTWTFHLRPDVVFHDNHLLTATDVVASLTRVRDNPPDGELGTTGVYQSYLMNSDIQTLDADTVSIRLSSATADLLDILAELAILRADDVSPSAELPPGSGPFRLIERHDNQVVLERHQAYWGSESPAKQLVYQALASAQKRSEALLMEKVDIAVDLVSTHLVPQKTVVFQPSSTTTTFMFNLTSLEKPVIDLRVRRALNYAVDVETLIAELMNGQAEAASSPCTPPQLGFDANLKPLAYDPEKARTLLAEADSDGLEIVFDIPEVLPDEAPALAEILVAQFADVGVKLDIRRHADRSGYATKVRNGEIGDAACFDSSPRSSYRLFREKFHAGVKGVWWLGYQNDTFDNLVDTASREPAVAKRQSLYRRAAQLLRDDAPWLYLYTPRLCWGLGKAVSGWRPTDDGLVDLAAPKGRI